MDFANFEKLKCVKLADSRLSDIVNFAFPDSLDVLDLSKSYITSIEGVKFPKILVSLNPCSNFPRSIAGVQFPPTLRRPNLNIILINAGDIQKSNLHENFHIETLYLGGQDKIDFSCCMLLENLHSLSLCHCIASNSYRFGHKLKSLQIEYCDYTNGMSIGECFNLKYLYI